MTMHVVLGDGTMTRKELTETLADIWKADQEADATFWFLIQGKAEPTDTDKALVAWLEKNEIYYEVITDDADAVDAIYSQPQETHVAKQLGRKIINLLKGKPEDGEEAEVLALFASDDSDAEEDRWLNGVIQEVFDAGFKTRALNDGLVEIDLTEAPEEPEQTAKVTPIKKAVAKKGGAAPRRDTPVSDEDETEASSASKSYSRDELEEMDLPALKKIAEAKGIELPARSRMTTYIDTILGEDRPAAEVEAPAAAAASNGEVEGIDIDELADAIAEKLLEKFVTALTV